MGLGWAWARVHGEGADEKRRVWKLPVLFVDPLPASVDFDSMSTTLGTCTRTGSAQNGTLNRSVGSRGRRQRNGHDHRHPSDRRHAQRHRHRDSGWLRAIATALPPRPPRSCLRRRPQRSPPRPPVQRTPQGRADHRQLHRRGRRPRARIVHRLQRRPQPARDVGHIHSGCTRLLCHCYQRRRAAEHRERALLGRAAKQPIHTTMPERPAVFTVPPVIR